MSARVTVALIVKNEQATVGRALSSVIEHVDEWLVIDTGSSDATEEVVRAAAGSTPGRFLHDEWRDFSWNRNRLAAQVQTEWALYMDADHTITGAEHLQALTAAADPSLVAYRICSEEEPRYWNPRLVRPHAGHWTGRTHEALRFPAGTVTRTELLTIKHHADGGSRADKLQRDLQLLTLDLKDEDSARTRFYLGMSLWGFETAWLCVVVSQHCSDTASRKWKERSAALTVSIEDLIHL